MHLFDVTFAGDGGVQNNNHVIEIIYRVKSASYKSSAKSCTIAFAQHCVAS